MSARFKFRWCRDDVCDVIPRVDFYFDATLIEMVNNCFKIENQNEDSNNRTDQSLGKVV